MLEDYWSDMISCSRCSYCKYIPFAHVWDKDFSYGCPSVSYKNFHSYSASGKLIAGLLLLEKKIDFSDTLIDVAYKCLICGACHISCQICRILEPLDIILELRTRLVENGQFPDVFRVIIDNLRKEDNTQLKPKKDRGKWAEGLDVKDLTKEPAEVLFHAGCLLSYDEELWPIVRGAVELLKDAGVDVGILGSEEVCCGGRVFSWGFSGEFAKYAESNMNLWKSKGVKIIVTACAECYNAFIYRYPQHINQRLYDAIGVKVFHITQYLNQLVKEGKLKLAKPLSMKVTYQDPCKLGRLGEPYEPWSGEKKKVRNGIIIRSPPKPRRLGARGVYDPPRELLKAIPNLELVEMKRIREFAWCCGGGGGVRDYDPDFASWTASKRIEEAKTVGAEAIITACPWCKRNFLDTIKKNKEKIEVYDVVELIQKAIGG